MFPYISLTIYSDVLVKKKKTPQSKQGPEYPDLTLKLAVLQAGMSS